MIDLVWRVGTKLGRTLYAMLDPDVGPQRHDVLLGMVDDPFVAQHIVEAHNHWLKTVRNA